LNTENEVPYRNKLYIFTLKLNDIIREDDKIDKSKQKKYIYNYLIINIV